MTATAVDRSRSRSNRGLQGLAGALGFVCLVLFLMAIEQKQAMEAWAMLRDEAAPAAGRIVGWAVDGAVDGVDGLKSAAKGSDDPLAATPNAVVLAGEFRAADDATRETVGAATFTGALIRLEQGDVLRTRPLRIAGADEAYSAARKTFAAELDARPNAQIELRQIIPHARAEAVFASPLCGGEAPGVVALLHRRDRVDMMLFRGRTIVGPDAPADALCGVWRFRAR
jgi:hypothetical protein